MAEVALATARMAHRAAAVARRRPPMTRPAAPRGGPGRCQFCAPRLQSQFAARPGRRSFGRDGVSRLFGAGRAPTATAATRQQRHSRTTMTTRQFRQFSSKPQQRTILSYPNPNPNAAATPPRAYYNATPTPHPLLRLLGQSLHHALLKPRSLPLPRYISPTHSSFTLSELCGHSSFILVAASYYSQDFLELRLMAVLGSASMLFFTYFHPHGRVLWLPLKWNVLFIAINSYRIGKVYYDRYRADQLSDELKAFREEVLPLMDKVDYWKLVSMAEEEVYEEGDLVLHQGSANPSLRVVLEGELEVLRDGTLTYVLEKGNFVSEAGLHAGLTLRGSIESCASIVVGPPFDPTGRNNVDNAGKKNRVRCLRWNRGELMDLLEQDRGLRNALKAALSWDIVRKLKTQRHMLAEGRVKNPTAWTRKREDQGISRYAAILQNMLRHPQELEGMRPVLTKYRIIHHIGDADHARALARCGWTEAEFDAGKRRATVAEDEDEEDVEGEEFEGARWRRVKRYSSKLVRSLLQ